MRHMESAEVNPMQTTFDTLSYAEALKDAGVPDAQARIHAQTLRSLIDSEIATKQDIEIATQRVMAELELSTQRIKADLERTVKDLEIKLTIRMGAMLSVVLVVVAALKLL
jgi:hypothetical protein